jgi:Baseplate J-like protein
MANIPTQSFSTWLQNFAAGVQGRASLLVDFAVGAVLRSFGEGVSGVALWLQTQALLVLQAARLSTAVGTDVDTFTVDFMPAVPGSVTTALPNGSPRLQANPATGQVTYGRLSPGANAILIPNGSLVQSNDGTQQYTVIADSTNLAYSAALNGYTLAAAATSVSVLVQGVTPNPSTGVPGSNGNISAGAISANQSSIAGIDFVVNAAAFTNGVDGETDAALKARFSLYILGLSRGDIYGVESALAGLNVSIVYTIVDQYTYSGVFSPGFFYVVVDDGSGVPPPAFLTAAANAVNAVKPLGVQFGIFAPLLVTVNASLIISCLPGYTPSVVVAAVQVAIATNLTLLGLGAGTGPYQIAEWAQAVPGVAPNGITAVVVNSLTGDAADIAPDQQVRLMPGIIAVSATSGASTAGPTPSSAAAGQITAPTTLSGSGLYVVTVANVTITLPLWAVGLNITIKDQTGVANPHITIVGQGVSTIDGASSYVITVQNESVTIVPSYATNLWVID